MAVLRSRRRRSAQLAALTVGLLLFSALAPLHAGAGERDEGTKPYTVMEGTLDPVRRAFNADKGSVRLMFVSGPACAVCLRGLADMNEHLLSDTRDPRLRTYVVHVPARGARETHVAPSLSLIDNPHVRHYWDAEGVIGRRYRQVLGIDQYAWDVWMIYGPQAVWQHEQPPKPAFWMHQLRGLSGQRYLDAEVFATRVRDRLRELPEKGTK